MREKKSGYNNYFSLDLGNSLPGFTSFHLPTPRLRGGSLFIFSRGACADSHHMNGCKRHSDGRLPSPLSDHRTPPSPPPERNMSPSRSHPYPRNHTIPTHTHTHKPNICHTTKTVSAGGKPCLAVMRPCSLLPMPAFPLSLPIAVPLSSSHPLLSFSSPSAPFPFFLSSLFHPQRNAAQTNKQTNK